MTTTRFTRRGEEQNTEFAVGYRVGFMAGDEVGYGRAKLEGDREFLARGRMALDGGPSLDELARRRATLPERMPHCGCNRCSVCIRQSWIRHHGSDFAGRLEVA